MHSSCSGGLAGMVQRGKRCDDPALGDAEALLALHAAKLVSSILCRVGPAARCRQPGGRHDEEAWAARRRPARASCAASRRGWTARSRGGGRGAQGAARAAGAQLPSFSNGPAPPRPETPLTLAEAVYGFGQPAPEGAVWQNRDNERHEDGRYAKFIDEIKSEARIDPKRIYTDAARTFAYGTDASFYRLIPKVVVRVSDGRGHPRAQDRRGATRPSRSVAAGIALGQACTDSVLIKLSHNGRAWRRYEIADEGEVWSARASAAR